MSKVIKMLFLLCLLFLALASCSNERIVDQLTILTTLGFDKNESGYSGTAFYVDHAQKVGKINFVQGKSKQIKLLLNEINNKSSKPVDIAKMRMIMFSKELASEGISSFISTICKDPLLSNYLYIAITEDSMTSFTEELKDKNRDDLPYLTIDQNMKAGNIPKSNLAMVLYDFYGEGRDLSVPLIRLNKNAETEIIGYGIFKNERLKIILNREEMTLYKLLQGQYIQGDIPFKINGEGSNSSAVFTITYGKLHKTFSKNTKEKKATYRFTLNGMIKELPEGLQEDNLLLPLKEQLKKDLISLLHKFQDEGVDPLGTGDFVRAHTRDWDEKRFYEDEYSAITYEVDLNLHLSKSGIGE